MSCSFGNTKGYPDEGEGKLTISMGLNSKATPEKYATLITSLGGHAALNVAW